MEACKKAPGFPERETGRLPCFYAALLRILFDFNALGFGLFRGLLRQVQLQHAVCIAGGNAARIHGGDVKAAELVLPYLIGKPMEPEDLQKEIRYFCR